MSWVTQNVEQITALAGETIVSIAAIEMSLTENENQDLQLFRHTNYPFIQMQFLEVLLENGHLGIFVPYQANDVFGICFKFVQSSWINDRVFPEVGIAGNTAQIFRPVPDISHIKGQVSNVIIQLDEYREITEITFTVGDHRVLLKAGEVYEHENGLTVTSSDESILFFLNADDVHKVIFNGKPIPLDETKTHN